MSEKIEKAGTCQSCKKQAKPGERLKWKLVKLRFSEEDSLTDQHLEYCEYCFAKLKSDVERYNRAMEACGK